MENHDEDVRAKVRTEMNDENCGPRHECHCGQQSESRTTLSADVPLIQVPDAICKDVQTSVTLLAIVSNESETESENQFRRSTSLRIGKQKGAVSSTPAQKKMVRFADVLGLDLASVRTFLDEWPPTVAVPKSAYVDDDDNDALVASMPEHENRIESPALVPMFVSPAESADFADRIRSTSVCLETACVREAPVRHIAGRIKVANLDFCKSVYVRYTSDEWKTYAEVRATYVPPETESNNCCSAAAADFADQQSYDRFAFVIYVYDSLSEGDRIEFAIRYHCRDSVYWDNNEGNNYAFRRAAASDFPIHPVTAPSSPSCIDNFHHPFY